MQVLSQSYIDYLFDAVLNCDTELLAVMLEDDCNVKMVKNSEGDSLLHELAYSNNSEDKKAEVFGMLMKAGADVYSVDSDGNSFLEILICFYVDNVKILERLLNDGSFKINMQYHKNNKPPLMIAFHDGCVNLVKLLLRYGADVNAISDGYSVLMVAVDFYDADKSNKDRFTIVGLIVDFCGIDLNYQEHEFGTTALIRAGISCMPDVVKLLIDKGANLDIKACDSLTALDIVYFKQRDTSNDQAKKEDYTKIINLLEEAIAKKKDSVPSTSITDVGSPDDVQPSLLAYLCVMKVVKN